VLSQSGRVVGSTELLVVSERVDVDALVVGVISGVSLSFVGASAELPRTLVANVTLHSQLTHKYQVFMSHPSALSTTFICFDFSWICRTACCTTNPQQNDVVEFVLWTFYVSLSRLHWVTSL